MMIPDKFTHKCIPDLKLPEAIEEADKPYVFDNGKRKENAGFVQFVCFFIPKGTGAYAWQTAIRQIR